MRVPLVLIFVKLFSFYLYLCDLVDGYHIYIYIA